MAPTTTNPVTTAYMLKQKVLAEDVSLEICFVVAHGQGPATPKPTERVYICGEIDGIV